MSELWCHGHAAHGAGTALHAGWLPARSLTHPLAGSVSGSPGTVVPPGLDGMGSRYGPSGMPAMPPMPMPPAAMAAAAAQEGEGQKRRRPKQWERGVISGGRDRGGVER